MMDSKEWSSTLDCAKKHIKEGQLSEAILLLNNTISTVASLPGFDSSEAFYLLGNAYRKKGDFQAAMNYYEKSIAINADNPAVEARKALQSIMAFYNKDMYNH